MKVALITGGSRGIGKACAKEFAKAGYHVVFTCQKRADLAENLVHELAESGLSAEYIIADVSSNEDVQRTVAHTLEKYHHIDVLVNNAGISCFSLAQEMALEQWQHVFDVNMTGAFLMSREVLPHMISAKHGSIVNISSMWGQVGSSCEAAYSASKAALIGFTKALAKEVAPSGIRVNAVAPGVIDTDMNKCFTAEEMQDIAQDIPMERIGKPEEVAKAVLFLSSDDSSYITGQVLGVNGGMVV